MSLVCLADCMFVPTLCTLLCFCWQINDDDDDEEVDNRWPGVLATAKRTLRGSLQAELFWCFDWASWASWTYCKTWQRCRYGKSGWYNLLHTFFLPLPITSFVKAQIPLRRLCDKVHDIVDDFNLIPCLHDQAGSTSCYMLAGRASSMFARSCKRGITQQ